MASPSEMNAYYEDFPTPPEEPGDDATKEQRDQFQKDKAAFEKKKEEHEKKYGSAPEPDPVVPPAPPGGGGGGGGGGMPAARLGDMCAHGGTIVVGCPTVLIGGKPAARIGDMHVCPMVTGVVPHVGGPIAKGSATVLIGNMPAARVTDMATCVGPPDTIALGEFTVLIA